MIKLLLSLASALLIGVLLLELRQQRLEISYQANKIHNQIESRQAMLWNQQLQIAISTAPTALAQTLGQKNLNISPTPTTPLAAAPE